MNLKHIVAAAAVAVLGSAVAFAAGKAAAPITAAKPSELKWGPAVPDAPPGGPQVAVVWGDPMKGPVGFFLKVPPGNNSGVHMHTADYRGVVIQGSITASETDDPKAEALPTGSYYFQPGKQFHNNVCKGTQDCIVYIEFLNGGIDLIPKDKPAAPAKK